MAIKYSLVKRLLDPDLGALLEHATDESGDLRYNSRMVQQAIFETIRPALEKLVKEYEKKQEKDSKK